MALEPESLVLIFGLGAAFSWGAGDFLGGFSSKRAHTAHVAWVSALFGLGLLTVLALAAAEPLPGGRSLGLATLAGLAGSIGILLLYRGLAEGKMALVAPVTAVTFAAVPVLFEGLTMGLPSHLQMAGFVLAGFGIVLVTGKRGTEMELRGLGLGVGAGVGFGVFTILMSLLSPGSFLWPLAVAKASALVLPLAWVALARVPFAGVRGARWTILGAGILDAAGNAFILGGSVVGRLDVTVVLAALYPAVTLLLAWLVLKERLRGWQAVGVACAITAVPLIAS